MKGLLLSVFTLLVVQGAWAGNQYDASELTDAALIQELDAIAGELEASNHDQEIMNMAYNRARVVRKQLNKSLDKVDGIEDATDDDILPLLADIADEINNLAHSLKTLEFSKNHLDQILLKLEENRQAPTEIAVLTIDGADPLDFGTIFVNGFTHRILTITNNGNGSATIINETGLADPFKFSGFSGYPGVFGNCGNVIIAGASCTVSFEYHPVSIGAYSTQMQLIYFDGVENQVLTKDIIGNTQ